jgi:hypothetical protein
LIRALIVGRKVVLALVALVLIGGVALVLTNGAPSVPLMPSMPKVALPGGHRAPEATENFLKGQQTYDLQLLLSGLSDDSGDRARSRASMEALQRQLSMNRERGIKFEQFNYIGGQDLPDGTSLQFYVVFVRGPAPRTDLEPITYIFTLDRGGKITRVQ